VVLFWLGVGLMCSAGTGIVLYLAVMHFVLRWKYLAHIERIFLEKPLFIIPRGQPWADVEDVRFPTSDGLQLAGCYWATRQPRRGVILFGLEFGSNRWSCRAYCEHLSAAGYDVFAFEARNQGDSDSHPGYEPLQWVTDHEVRDTEAALAYLKARPDADPRGIGFFGISKGGGAGLIAASRDPSVLCCVTDGIFGTYTTVVPYMRYWFQIYNNNRIRQAVIPSWYYGLIAMVALRGVGKSRQCRFPHLEKALRRLAPRPVLMIHGEGDTYIKPTMAQSLFRRLNSNGELWLVPGAKHNQALQLVGDEYRRRVLNFFDEHLAAPSVAATESVAQVHPALTPAEA
jgi:alpha-beta hydrolase superfamily lysophospholipase